MSRQTRLRTLEGRIKPQKCPQCFDYPVRVVYRNDATDEITSESMPADGCPGCGLMPVRELIIVFDEQEVSA